MESILRSDIFFFITSIAVIIVTIFLLVALFYFIKMLRNFYKISKILKDCAVDTEDELRDMAHQVRSSKLFTFVFGKAKEKTEEPEKRSRKI